MHGERKIRGAVGAGVLHDHIDFDIGIGDRPEYAARDARFIRHSDHSHLRFVAIQGDARNEGLFHDVFLCRDQGPLTFFER